MGQANDFRVVRGKITRNELALPNLYFVAVDDWMDKLGEKSFCLWMKLYTVVDRTENTREKYGEDGAITSRKSKLIDRLGISKSTFLRQIKPLYEYGFIDLFDFEDSKNKGEKPVTIVVYKYPCNDKTLETKPLEKVRDWRQRVEEKYNFSTKGGRPKNKTNESSEILHYNPYEED